MIRRARGSSVVSLVKCAGLWLARVDDQQGSGGPAAQTGSAVGRLIQLFHEGWVPAEAWNIVEREGAQWPDANMEDVLTMGSAYFLDPRNGPASEYGTVEPGSCEKEVTLRVEADEIERTLGLPGEPFEIVGHLDQLRRGRDGVLRVWDLKSGKPSGDEMLQEYHLQLAVYALAATATLGELVLPGGIIRLRAYQTKGPAADRPHAPGVFWETRWTTEDCEAALDNVRHEIAMLRSGRVVTRAGLHCRYCPLNPHHDCRHRLPNPHEVGGTTEK